MFKFKVVCYWVVTVVCLFVCSRVGGVGRDKSVTFIITDFSIDISLHISLTLVIQNCCRDLTGLFIAFL